MRRVARGVAAGLLFGLGLAVSGLASPGKLLNAFDIAGRWDPSLLLTAAAALAVSLPASAWLHRRAPGLGGASRSPLPEAPGRGSKRLLAGSAIFGIGCGIAGYVPATAVANLSHATSEAVLFVIALLVGSQLARWARRRWPTSGLQAGRR